MEITETPKGEPRGALIARLYAEQDGRCYYCHRKTYLDKYRYGDGIRQGKKFNIEHKIPTSRGGTDDRENIVGSCSMCNSYKGKRTPEEFMRYVIRRGGMYKINARYNDPKRNLIREDKIRDLRLNEKMTYREIGHLLNISRQRVMQICHRLGFNKM